MKKSLVICIALFLCAGSALVQEPVDLDMINKIRDKGFNRSQVMEKLARAGGRNRAAADRKPGHAGSQQMVG